MDIKKRLIAVVCVCLIAASAAIGVSADYVTMIDNGLGYCVGWSSGSSVSINYVGSGDKITGTNLLLPFWAIDSFEPDTTYTCIFDCSITTSHKPVFSSAGGAQFTSSNRSSTLNTSLSKVYVSAETYTQNGQNRLKVTCKFNTSLLNLNYFPLYIYAFVLVDGASTQYNFNFYTGSWGMSCEYDPGGSKFLEDYLADIKDQLHQGDDKLDSIPSNTDLSNGVSSIDSAESAILSASDPSGTALSDFSEKGKTTVTTINTSYRNTFAFINTLVTKVMDDLDFGILVFLALTLGLVAYVLGRIK